MSRTYAVWHGSLYTIEFGERIDHESFDLQAVRRDGLAELDELLDDTDERLTLTNKDRYLDWARRYMTDETYEKFADIVERNAFRVYRLQLDQIFPQPK